MTNLKTAPQMFTHKKPNKGILVMAFSIAAVTTACSTNETQTNKGQATEDVTQSKEIEARLYKQKKHEASAAKLAPHPLFADAASPQLAISSNIRVAPIAPAESERYSDIEHNNVMSVSESPVSTFSIDVDTASYANTRRFINNGQQPPANAVRTEELINYFDYHYAPPSNEEQPFSVHYELGPSPWNSDRTLLHVGIQGYKDIVGERPPANLVFLVDVSGSMNSANKLPLVKKSLRLLTKQLTHNDRISLVVYAGSAQVVLEPTAGDKTFKILQAIDQLQPGGSTHGSAGIELAYQLGQQAHIDKGINRVMLATDGDFNVGLRSMDELKQYIEEKRSTGLQLSVLGYGTGNYNDELMEELSNRGNGNAAYIDNLKEAQKVLIDEMGSTLHTIASDVKLQMEFNPQWVQEYRLIGYENRVLAREDFNNDKVDAGDIGAGHSLTAIYELTLSNAQKPWNDPLRYKPSTEKKTNTIESSELGLLKIRYKLPDQTTSKLLQFPVDSNEINHNINNTSEAFRFASSVAGFAELLRRSQYIESYGYDDVIRQAEHAKGQDRYGYRSEFVQMARLAQALSDEAIRKD
ncbi:vWA domain-containing protein [Alkalimarinus sediminis]|uniref:VWA domain-containing protein n=1 Tax=Alkalimarinus sediminis TaxID=1632866 RepID=A0A9E8HHJ3_9ALTE|nr:VWA domain-containing protein [Alkalimarinus sediminis]UZW74790.1 VWA domain-containing protein [Alkalimarinus sediminis]